MRKTQTGSFLLEALAIFALFALTLPIIFSKYAQRMEDLDNRLIADNVRAVQFALNRYIKENFTVLTGNQIVFGAAGQMTPGQVEQLTVPITVLEPYLPKGFANRTKQVQEYKIGLRRERNAADTETSVGGLIVLPAFNAPENRLIRIASMIGADAGFIRDDGIVYSFGGLWTIADPGSFFTEGSVPAQTLAVGTVFAIEQLKFQMLQSAADTIGPDFEPFLYRQAAGGSTPVDKHIMETFIDMDGNGIMNVSEIKMTDTSGKPTMRFVIINDPTDMVTARFDMAGLPVKNIGRLTQDGTVITAEKAIERGANSPIDPRGGTDLKTLRLGSLMGHDITSMLSGYVMKDVFTNVRNGDKIEKPACPTDYTPMLTFSVQNHQSVIRQMTVEEISAVSPGDKNVIYRDNIDHAKLYDTAGPDRTPAYRIVMPFDGAIDIGVSAETATHWTVSVGSENPGSVRMTVHTYCRSDI